MTLRPGLEATVGHEVRDADTARSLGSGDVAVWGTPSVVALCERAAVQAVAESLDEGSTSVGTRIDLEHLAPTSPGARVQARATLATVDGRRLEFDVEAFDPAGTVARGRHTRVVVDHRRFEQGARDRA